jgi:magnesium transporter
MMYAYINDRGRLRRLAAPEDLRNAIWIDLIVPTQAEVDGLAQLGVEVPSLADMEEIEISNRLYREEGFDYMTAVLPGERADGQRAAMPVSFILSGKRLVTVRHHSPRPFLTFPQRGEKSTLGCATPDRLFVGLLEEVIARLADILESSGRLLDETTTDVFDTPGAQNGQYGRGRGAKLQKALREIGGESELLARVRLGLLTIERILAFYTATMDERPEADKLRPVIRGQLRDVQALEVHADFLGGRISLAVDTTLGMISLEQNDTVRILSVVAALFLPPTLIASIYGMNFTHMPELDDRLGYPFALLLMAITAGGTWLFLRWKNWL